jgi:cation diffusion facilitator family transporter
VGDFWVTPKEHPIQSFKGEFAMEHCCEKKTAALLQLRVKQGKVLKIVMAVNFVMFGAEFAAGVFANSTALMADSLDMLGDGIVYAFSLYVLHRSVKWRASAALLKGGIIVIFGAAVLIEAISKLNATGLPISQTMGLFGFLALVANASCLVLLYTHRDDDINMKSTWICSRNDIISNVGVLVAASLVWTFQSKWPDVIVGFVIAILFLRSAWPILTEALKEFRRAPILVHTSLK